MKFIDEATIDVEAGHGGSGAKHFRREKYVPYGGPDGGNGGRGGSVILVADENTQTLLDLRFNPHWKAENGGSGEGSRKDGKAGQDLFIKVPVGTQVLQQDTRELVVDLFEDKQEFVIAHGGRGGLGNAAFKSSTNRTPEYYQPGEEGELGTFILSLKLVADVGLVGFPNAGKSTLISAVSAARPKIADYPFTTLIPNLGVVKYDDRSFVIADIPGLIPDAHQGKGLGIRFLKHIERTKILVHLVDASQLLVHTDSTEVLTDAYKAIKHELSEFSEELALKKEIVVLTKLDLLQPEDQRKAELAFKNLGINILSISSATRKGLDKLLNTIADTLWQN